MPPSNIPRSRTELVVNGRTYEIYCAPEDLEKLKVHGARFADMVEQMVRVLGQIGDAPLFLLACLQLLDELEGTNKLNKRFESGTRFLDVAHNVRYNWEIILNRLSKRIEDIAEELERQQEEVKKR